MCVWFLPLPRIVDNVLVSNSSHSDSGGRCNLKSLDLISPLSLGLKKKKKAANKTVASTQPVRIKLSYCVFYWNKAPSFFT